MMKLRNLWLRFFRYSITKPPGKNKGDSRYFQLGNDLNLTLAYSNKLVIAIIDLPTPKRAKIESSPVCGIFWMINKVNSITKSCLQ